MPRTMVIYRRHVQGCKHYGSGPGKGRDYQKCHCPIWLDGVKDSQRHHYSLKTADWPAAVKELARIERRTEVPSRRIDEAIKSWRKSLSIEESTWRNYRQPIRAFEAYTQRFGPSDIDQVTATVISNFRDWRKVREDNTQRLCAGSSNRELGVLRIFFGWCLKRGWCLHNPATLVDMYKVRPVEREPFQREEIAAMFAACDKVGHLDYERKRAKALFLLMRHTALRISDAATLSRNRVQNGRLLLWTRKTGGQVFLPLPGEVEQALEALPVPIGGDRGYYFWNGKCKARAIVGMCQRLVAAVFKRAGFKRSQPHRFRHTMATEILARGGTIQDVADVLGITPAIAYKHYAKWSSERQNRIDRIMSTVTVRPMVEEEERPHVSQYKM